MRDIVLNSMPYEMIVKNQSMEQNIQRYISMNPWKCIVYFANGLCGMGNPSLWNQKNWVCFVQEMLQN